MSRQILPLVLVVAQLGCGGGSGTDGGIPDSSITCLGDMVPVGEVCIDRYESSNNGSDGAASVASAEPWISVTWDQANAACLAVGKRLCEEYEWRAACRGPDGDDFPYGDTYDPEACNGYENGANSTVPTGSMATCEGGFDNIYDMSGNVQEWTNTCSGTNCRQVGGSFSSTSDALDCASGAMIAKGSTGLVLGFRCCLTP